MRLLNSLGRAEHQLLEQKQRAARNQQGMDEAARVDRHPKADADRVEHAEQVAADVDGPHVAIAEVEDRGGVDDAERDHAGEQEAADVF